MDKFCSSSFLLFFLVNKKIWVNFVSRYMLWSPSISIWRVWNMNLRISSWNPFFIQGYSVFFFFKFILILIKFLRNLSKFKHYSLSLSNEFPDIFFFFPFFASKSSYLRNKFIEWIPFASLLIFFFFLSKSNSLVNTLTYARV